MPGHSKQAMPNQASPEQACTSCRTAYMNSTAFGHLGNQALDHSGITQTIMNHENAHLKSPGPLSLQGIAWLSCLCAGGICCSAGCCSTACYALQGLLLQAALCALFTVIVWCWSRSDCICRSSGQVCAQGSLSAYLQLLLYTSLAVIF